MKMLDLIAKKRSGGKHDAAELEFLAREASRGGVPDYQLSAWLMAVCLRGMSETETVALTRAMAASGRPIESPGLGRPAVDKHSTGGVGDGISLALAPLVASAGLVVPMMSGRGLGHTGGTLDKLEAIPGFRVRLGLPEIGRLLREVGVCMFGQTEELAPADRRLYALRDATATVESRPLVVSSILSKKLAEGLDGLVLDVKCGSGAIFRTQAGAEELGRALVRTARRLGLRSVALVTAMDQPLGRAVGNALEVRQTVEVLRGEGRADDFTELLLALGGWMLRLAGKVRRWEEGAERLKALIESGAALAKFKAMVAAQGGDPRVADDPDGVLPKAPRSAALRAERSGFLLRLDARGVGEAAAALGAGRCRMEDAVDYAAGVLLLKKRGDRVEKGEELARLYAGDPARLAEGAARLEASLAVGPRRPPAGRLVLKVLK